MKLNLLEKLAMNNPVRAALQRHYELPLLLRMGGDVQGLTVLEVGCGRGVGTELLLAALGAGEVVAFDLDPAMVAKAQRRLRAYPPERVRIGVGDATRIAVEAASFDAVFDFGVIHHVPAWQDAVSEIARVLRPGGRFFFEEVTTHALNRWTYRTFFDHPKENRFSALEFIAELERRGLEVGGNFVERVRGDFVIGVARRA